MTFGVNPNIIDRDPRNLEIPSIDFDKELPLTMSFLSTPSQALTAGYFNHIQTNHPIPPSQLSTFLQ